VLLGGVSLALFAYRFPHNDQPSEARYVAGLMSGLLILAMGYTLVFNFQYYLHTPRGWMPLMLITH
jgi:hypothetical protein